MDELLLKQVPNAPEAEGAILGSMFIDPQCIPVVIESIRAEDFYFDENRAIFETIYAMFTEAMRIDAVTVLEELTLRGVYNEAGGREYILKLMDITPTAANVQAYCAIVRDKSMLREIRAAGEFIVDLVQENADDAAGIAEMSEQRIYSIRQDREIHGLVHVKGVLGDVYAQIDELAKNGGMLRGIPTGFKGLDGFLGGLNKSDLILIASRPGMGKTSFALNMALHAANATDKDVVIFQLEMSKEQLVERLLSNEALVDLKKLRTGNLDEDEWLKIARASNSLSKTKIYIDDNPMIKTAEMTAKCRRLGAEVGLIIIDYLQLMQGSKRAENRVNEISEISRSLKIMAKELNVPIICLSQLSREPEKRGDKRPMLSDLRESGAIEQDADIVLFLYRDDYYNQDSEERNVAEVIIAKNRHGATGTIKLQWLGQFTVFSSQDTIHDERSF